MRTKAIEKRRRTRKVAMLSNRYDVFLLSKDGFENAVITIREPGTSGFYTVSKGASGGTVSIFMFTEDEARTAHGMAMESLNPDVEQWRTIDGEKHQVIVEFNKKKRPVPQVAASDQQLRLA